MELIRSVEGESTAYLILHADKLDMSNASEFKRASAAAIRDVTRVVLDLSEVEFVDSTGLGAILSCLRDLNARNGSLRLCGIQRRVQVMFELVRMHRVLPIYPDKDAALASLAEANAAA